MDSAVVAMASMLVFAAASAPMFGYYEKADAVSTTYVALVDELEKTHLFEEGVGIPSNSLAEERVTDWIQFQIQGSSDDDFLLYCDTQYLGLSIAEHNARFAEASATYFAVNESGAMGLSDMGTSISRAYLLEAERNSETVDGYSTIRDDIYDVYLSIFQDVVESENHAYSSTYRQYGEAQDAVRHAGGGASLVAYFLTAGIYYLALPFAFKRGRTMSKKFLHLEVTTLDADPASPIQILSRGLTSIIESLFLTGFAPFFFISFQGFTLPVMTIGGFSLEIWVIAVVGLLLTLVSGCLCLFSKQKATLHDLTTFTRVVEEPDLEQYRRLIGKVQ